MNDFTITVDGKDCSATYDVFDNDLVVYLPDGTQSETTLHSANAELFAHTHLRAWVKQTNRQKQQ